MTVSPSNLQQCNPDEDAGHHRQVVLKPFLKLGDAAFNVDEVPLLSVLVKHTEKKPLQPPYKVEKAIIMTKP